MIYTRTDNSIASFRPKILLLGKTGQIGTELLPRLREFAELHATERREVDLSKSGSIRELVRFLKPDVIINAAAYTAVDKAESEPALATAINTTAPSVLAEEAARLRALLVHYSTDYVFDGTKSGPYLETDATNPLNVYGKTKAAGEDGIRASGCNHLIFRTSWIYGPRGSNFLLTILRLAREREELRIVDDQIGAPTSSEAVARATVQAVRQYLSEDPSGADAKTGTYHMTSAGDVSWFGFASEIVRQCTTQQLCLRKLIPIPSGEYPTPAQRPLNSRLSCSKLSQEFGITLSGWQTGLLSVLDRLTELQRSAEFAQRET